MDSYTVIAYSGLKLPDAYRNMIYSKWLRSLRYSNDYFRLIAKGPYFKTYQRFIEKLLNKPNTMIRLAVLSDNHDVCLGFCVYRHDRAFHILDYVHVHKDHRRQGIGSMLVPPNIIAITHLTRIGLSIWGSKMKDVAFNPFC